MTEVDSGSTISSDSYVCDPTYEDCESYNDALWWYDYDKSDVHFMTWMSLWQVAYPTIAFTSLEERAYNSGTANSRDTTSYWTEEVFIWEKIMKANMLAWGPMFLFGLLSLSEIAMPLTSFYIEHGLSNL